MSKLLRNMLGRVIGAGPDEEGGEAVGTGNDARVALLNSIGDNADRERGDDLADVNDDGSTSAFLKPDVDPEAQAEQAENDRLAAEVAAASFNEQTPAKIVRKINGVDTEITDEMITKAQKVGSADVFLSEAKRLRDELEGKQRQAANVEEVDTDLASIARAIQMGTEEEAVAALRKLQTKVPSPDDLSKKIDERLTFNDAYQKFTTEYKDIVGDPVLKKLAEEADETLLRQGDTRPYYARYSEIGDSLRNWLTAKGATKVDEDALPSKQERKAAAPAVPKTAQGRSASAVEDEKEESVADTIAAMAAQRGGPQWMNGQAQNR